MHSKLPFAYVSDSDAIHFISFELLSAKNLYAEPSSTFYSYSLFNNNLLVEYTFGASGL
jgi:hypothetical protein